MLLSKLEVPLALHVLCSVLGPVVLAHVFAAFFSDLTKDLYNCILLLRTCFESTQKLPRQPPASMSELGVWQRGAGSSPPPWGCLGLGSLCCNGIELLLGQALPCGTRNQPHKPGAASAQFVTHITRLCQ